MATPDSPVQIELDHPALTVDLDALRLIVMRVLEGEGASVESLTVVLSGHDNVLELNREYLQHDYLTDVLSFNLSDVDDPKIVDGEVYVDLDTAHERHQEFGASFEAEVSRYVVHGVLHLLGYPDDTPQGKAVMHDLEDRYLAA